jgi:hypothetical protein
MLARPVALRYRHHNLFFCRTPTGGSGSVDQASFKAESVLGGFGFCFF